MSLARWLLPLALMSTQAASCQAGASTHADPSIARASSVATSPPQGALASKTPDPALSAIAAAVVGAVRAGHYAQPDLDDTLSARWFDRYVEGLDPNRLYFTDADIAEFTAAWRTQLDDAMNAPAPDLSSAWAIHHRFVQRVDERVAFALALVERNGFTFDNPDAVLHLDRTEAPWASRAALDDVWRERVAEQILRMRLSGEEHERSKERLTARFERIANDVRGMEDLDVLEMFLGAFARTVDPHSSWFKPISKQNFDIEMSDKLTGIGARLQLDEGYTTIVELIAGGPAEKQGTLKPGDRIVAVAEGDGEPVDVVDMRLDRVVQLIRGRAGAVVTLTVHPADAADPSFTRQIPITRAEVKLADAQAKGRVEVRDGRKIGVIDVPSFYVDAQARARGGTYGSTATDVARILDGFRTDAVDAVVLDLRMNGGGALDQAIETTGLFLPGGPVVQVRDRSGKVDVLRDDDPAVAWDGPLVVLVSEASASASEILAAAIQDHGRGVIVGSAQTHGKGTVQNLVDLGGYLARMGEAEAAALAGAVKFTSHMFYGVDGASTQVRGVPADIVLPSVFAGLDILEGDLDNPLPWHQIEPARYRPSRAQADLDALRARSAPRVAAALEFAFLQEDLMRREAEQARTTLSLHEESRRAEIARQETLAKGRDIARELAGYDPEEPPDAILDETLHIAADLAAQLSGRAG